MIKVGNILECKPYPASVSALPVLVPYLRRLGNPTSITTSKSEHPPPGSLLTNTYRYICTAMTELLDLCYDVLIRILEEIEPEDLAACARTSLAFNNFVKENTRLYKAQYLKNFVSIMKQTHSADCAHEYQGRPTKTAYRPRAAMGTGAAEACQMSEDPPVK